MPTIAESGHQMNGDLIDNRLASTESWTDALPNCHQTGVGTQSNQLYKKNGARQEFHLCEDKSFHFHSNSNDNTYFYGLFDGHEGSYAANFVAQHLPAEFLLGQLPNQELTDDESTALIQSAFVSLEREYFQSIADTLAERTQLEYQLQGISSLEAYQEFPEIVDRLKVKTGEVSSGTAAVVALIHYNRLHVANVGDSKAILCRTDPSDPKNFKVSQLSTDHDLNNPNELSRLSSLGLEVDKLRQRQRIGTPNLSITRCIGNYLVKGAYKDLPDLSAAKDEPIIAEPSIKSVSLDDSCQFLLLASGSIFRALEDATGSHQVNSDLVRMVAEEFKIQSTLTGVAQAVINKICRIHQDEYLRSMDDYNLPQSRRQIEDLTLMVRNFNHPLIRGISSRSPSVSSMHRQFSDQLRISIDEEDEVIPDGDPFRGRSASRTLMTTTSHSVVSTVTDEHGMATESSSNTTTTTTNSTDFEDKRFNPQKADPLDVDSEGKIEAYIKFDEFFEAIKKAKANGQYVEWALD